ncbi:hypothetical protein VMCG_09853 [Cytospora schulzeri]|uniref:Sfi1 spindle body domain-containing protein n=1 Tax=Cytospora schulzeri TaxID=448051 RepID=A0A423VDP8_9PEZI|nr:hypothetical protein VMCG_09853 [Valsa malicola]
MYPKRTQSSPPDERETTESTFSEIQVLFSPTGDIELKKAAFPMHREGDDTPVPNGNGDGGSDNGRPSPTPIRSRPEPYYSNDERVYTTDITILHEIVATGEEILASLPERERLPTNALFSAADEVLPKHGYDSEDVPHISRLLFRIGGQRGEETLLDKFRSVLAEMGIEVVYTDDSMVSTEEGNDADVSDSDDPAGLSTPRPTARQFEVPVPNSTPRLPPMGSPSPMHYAPHRRRNSDSIAVSFVASGHELHNGEPGTRHARAHSAAGETPESQKKGVRFSDVVETQSISEHSWEQHLAGPPTIDDVPFRPRPGTDAVPDGSGEGLDGSAQEDMSVDQHDPEIRPTTRAENRAPPDFSSFGNQAQAAGSQAAGLSNGVPSDDDDESSSLDLVEDGEGDYVEELSLPTHPIQAEEVHDTRETERIDEEYNDLRHDEYSVGLPRRDPAEEENMNDAQMKYLTSREQMFRMSSFNHWARIGRQRRTRSIELESHAEVWDAWETIGEALGLWIETALTMHIDENDGLRAYQDHVRERETVERNRESVEDAAQEVAPVPPFVTEGSPHPRVRQSIERMREPPASPPQPTSSPRPSSDARQADRPAGPKTMSFDSTFVEELPYRPAPVDRQVRDRQAQRLQAFGTDWDQNVGPAGGRDDSFYDIPEEPTEPADPYDDIDVSIRSQYHIAAAAWDYFLLSKAFTHWANRADEEVQRTQVARRHILRKKCFSAWIGEGERDESESESKAVWFSQLVVIGQWQEVAQAQSEKNRRLHGFAMHRDGHDLIENTLVTWYYESKMQLAAAIDHARVTTAYLQLWQAEGRWLENAHEGAEGIFCGTMLGRYLRRWRAEARVQERAEEGAVPKITHRDEFLKNGLSLAWRQASDEASGRVKVAILQDLKEHANHWMYETRLRAWQEQQKQDLLDSSMYRWYCEWRLVLCKRVMEQQDKARFLEKWAGATKESYLNSRGLRHLAREVRYHDSITGFFNASMDALEQLEEGALYARSMILKRWGSKIITQWTGHVNNYQRLGNWSRLGRYYAAGEHTLSHWRDVRRQEWQRRMRKLYSDFRYRARCDTLKDSLDGWWQSTAAAVASGWEADDIRAEDDGALIFDCVGEWRARHEYVTFSGEVAEDADGEAHLVLWHSLVEAQAESRLDAAEYDFMQTASARWEAWELAAVSLRGRDRAVQEFMGHNARRDRRHLLGLWAVLASNGSVGGGGDGGMARNVSRVGMSASLGAGGTGGGGGGGAGADRVSDLGGWMDFRASRRSARWNTPAPVTGRSRMVTDITPFRTPARPLFTPQRPSFLGRVSSTTPAYRPMSEMTFGEDDDDDDVDVVDEGLKGIGG